MTDSHTHLTESQLIESPELFIANFIEKGGKALLNVGHDPESNLHTIRQAKKYGKDPRLSFKSAIGLHPQLFYPNSHYPQKITSNESLAKFLREYESLLEDNLQIISAIGETGLDYFRLFDDNELTLEQKENSRELQMLSFRRHSEIATEKKFPMTIHIREARDSSQCTEDAIKILCEVAKGEITGSFHSYTGTLECLKSILDLGFYIGFNGIITYKSADNVRDLLEATPLDKLLLETDAPYLPPQSVRENKNAMIQHGQPSDILEIAQKVAEVKGITVEKIIEETSRNFFVLFGD